MFCIIIVQICMRSFLQIECMKESSCTSVHKFQPPYYWMCCMICDIGGVTKRYRARLFLIGIDLLMKLMTTTTTTMMMMMIQLLHECVHTYTHTSVHSHTHTYPFIHTYIVTYVHTDICTYFVAYFRFSQQ